MNRKTALAGILALVTFIFSLPLMGSTIEVQNNDNDGSGSLRQAVLDAMSGDTITFASVINGDTTFLTGSQILLDKDLVIIGNGETETVIDGDANGRIFEITAGSDVELWRMTIQNGRDVLVGSGGGVNNDGTLKATNVTISGNLVVGTGVGGGGVYNSGTFTATNVTISGNSVVGFFPDGGGVYNSGTFTATNVTISGNSAIGQLADGGGVYNSGGTFTATNVTISGNTGLGPFSGGGGVYNDLNGTFTATNMTITGNSADFGGGVYNTNGDFTATNTIIWGNDAPNDPEIFQDGTQTYNYTLIKDIDLTVTGTGNFDGTQDPLFVAPELPATAPTTAGNYRLQNASQVRNAGDDAANTELFDLDGNPRKVGTIDLGPYENQTAEVFAVCKPNTFYLDENGVAVIIADSLDGGSTADLPIDTLIAVPNTLYCDSVGDRSVDLIVFDIDGNSDTCTATATILDTVKPTLVCANVTITLDGNGMAVIDSNYADRGSFDNCSIDSIRLSQTMFTCADYPDNDTLSMLVVDANGNVDSCEVVVTYDGVDFDMDGYFAECEDCNDMDPNINPGADEVCGDKIDNNCNDLIDEANALGYCCATGTNPLSYIDQVGLFYPFGFPANYIVSGPDLMGYGNYTDPKSNISSAFVPFVYFSIKPGLNRFSYIRIWVDWDQNGNFDPYEMMAQKITNTTWNSQFTVPFLLRNIPGEYYMRIGLSQRGFVNDPCEADVARAEFEDYIICIADGCGGGDDNPPQEPPNQLSVNNDQLSIEDVPFSNLQSSISIQLRPNPFRENLILETMLPNTGEMRVTILNQQGQTISTRLVQGSKGFNQLELETFSMAAGMYYIRVQSGDDVIVKRVVKQ